MEAGALRAPAGLNRVSVTAPLLRLRSDEQLVSHFRAGNEAAFGVIHDRYRQRLFAYARQMLGGSRQDAEDAMQDVFLRAYSALRADDRPVALRAWLYRVAHNRCIDQLRRPLPPQPDLLAAERRPLQDPLAETERREDLRRLVADVQRLPEQQRSALLMREIDGVTYAEIATALEVTVPAVKSLLVRARIGLVEAIEARDTACPDIRADLADTSDRGVRASARARRHLRDCEPCSEYRVQLRAVQRGLGALSPSGPGLLGAAAKLVGLGGAGSAGAASAGGAAAGSGAAAVGTGGAAALGTGTAAKVCAVVCVAITAGGAAEVRQHIQTPAHHRAPQHAPASPGTARPTAAPVPLPALRHRPAAAITGTTDRAHPARPAHERSTKPAHADDPVISPHGIAPPDAATTDRTTGGMSAPDEDTGFAPEVGAPDPVAAHPEPGPDAPAPGAADVPTAAPTAATDRPPAADLTPVAPTSPG
jgi:RNA polymerase sigma factor (sigma-70 family)